MLFRCYEDKIRKYKMLTGQKTSVQYDEIIIRDEREKYKKKICRNMVKMW